MPTKKKRVGFIPRVIVLDLIDKLSFESNLSYSKIINILVEEALYKRGLFNIDTGQVTSIFDGNKNLERVENINKEFKYNFKTYSNKCENIDNREETLDKEIYTKFLMFLQFQERIKKDT